MGKKSAKLTVQISSRALTSLEEVWDWNLEKHGLEHADNYISFLLTETDKLAANPGKGRSVPTRPELQYFTIKRSSGGYGHVAVYRINNDLLEVLMYYHTSQNWQSHAVDEAT